MRSLLLITLASLTFAQERYTGPKPPKPDVLYLVHADNLIPTEVADSKPESKHNETTYIIDGASSPARTPLAEPIFLIQADKIQPSALELYRIESKGNRREVSISNRHNRGQRALHLTVTPLGNNLYRVEADEELDDGEYAISPNGSDTVFCFEVY